MSEAGPKRFYETVTVAAEDGVYVIELDGRPAKTPGRHLLGAESQILAEALAAEWSQQQDTIDLTTMPLTRLTGFARDGGEDARGPWRQTILAYAGSDLLCYRAPETGLAARQAEIWDPFLARFAERVGAPLTVTVGIIAVEQDPKSLAAIEAYLDPYSPERLYAAKLLTEMTGSAVLALAALDEDAPAHEIFAASRLDETFQAERWGIDAEAAIREASLRRDFEDTLRFASLTP